MAQPVRQCRVAVIAIRQLSVMPPLYPQGVSVCKRRRSEGGRSLDSRACGSPSSGAGTSGPPTPPPWPSSAMRCWAWRSTRPSAQALAAGPGSRCYEPDLADLLAAERRVRPAAVHRLLRRGRGVRRPPLRLRRHAPAAPRAWPPTSARSRRAVDGLAPHLDRPALVVGKSTVPVGTAERMAARLAELAPAGGDAMLAWNPEFLREGFAVEDTLHPDRIVLGVARRPRREACCATSTRR